VYHLLRSVARVNRNKGVVSGVSPGPR
jgi:hypothetical protein